MKMENLYPSSVDSSGYGGVLTQTMSIETKTITASHATFNDLTNGLSSPRSRMIAKWKQADCVCFDVDSTVCLNEAIDDLAYFVGVGAQVEKM
jgi:phosphoserine phosphatase